MPRSESNEELTPQSTPEHHYEAMAQREVPDVDVIAPSRRHEGRSPNRAPPSDRDPSVDADAGEAPIDADRLLLYGAKQIIRLFVPVTICMLAVAIVIYSIPYYKGSNIYLPYTPFHSQNPDTGTLVWENLSNALIFIAIIIAVTILIVLLYKYRCHKIIYGWLVFTSLILLSLFTYIFFTSVCHTIGIFADAVSFVLIMWNFGVIGMISLYWKAPLRVQQAYLLTVSTIMALFFTKYLPDWTSWFLLGLLAVWDLIAVLCPKGPLRILVEIAQERQETLMPAIIYSTTAVWNMASIEGGDGGGGGSNNGGGNGGASGGGGEEAEAVGNQEAEDGGFGVHVVNDTRAERVQEQLGSDDDREQSTSSVRARSAVTALNGSNDVELAGGDGPAPGGSRTARNLREIQDEVLSREDRGVKLGLGDFVFYGVLVGKASILGDWNTTLACYVAILIGMCFTLLLLAIRGHALPALPISIFFGIIFFFCTSLLITPFTSTLADQQVFI